MLRGWLQLQGASCVTAVSVRTNLLVSAPGHTPQTIVSVVIVT